MSEDSPVDLRLASDADRGELLRMYAEQLRILHGFDPSIAPDQVLQDDWWQKPGELFPWMIECDGVSVGFCLVLGSSYVEAVGEKGDYLIWEMFLDEPQRGTGVAEVALRKMLAQQPGRWSVQAMPRNERAVRFWRRVLLQPPYSGTESEVADGFVKFRFVAP